MQITQIGTWLSELPNLTGLAPLSILKPSINSITETLQRGQRFVVQCTHLVCSFGAASTGSCDLSGLDSTTSMLAAHKMHHHCPARHLHTSLETYVWTGESITSGNRYHQFCSCCGSLLLLTSVKHRKLHPGSFVDRNTHHTFLFRLGMDGIHMTGRSKRLCNGSKWTLAGQQCKLTVL